MIYQCIGIAAFALNVWGNLELTTASNRGHIIRLFSNAVWIIYAPLVGAWALLLNHLTFAGINVLGFRRWRRLRVEHRTRGELPDHVRAVYEEAIAHRKLFLATGQQSTRLYELIDRTIAEENRRSAMES